MIKVKLASDGFRCRVSSLQGVWSSPCFSMAPATSSVVPFGIGEEGSYWDPTLWYTVCDLTGTVELRCTEAVLLPGAASAFLCYNESDVTSPVLNCGTWAVHSGGRLSHLKSHLPYRSWYYGLALTSAAAKYAVLCSQRVELRHGPSHSWGGLGL